MGTVASQITSLTIVYTTVYSDADQSKHQSSASLAFVWGIHRGPVNSPHKWPITRKMFPFDDVIMNAGHISVSWRHHDKALFTGRASYDNALRRMPQDRVTDEKSTLVQVMACCAQTTSQYLNQCWPASMSPYGVTRPQWVVIPSEQSFFNEISWQK